MRKERRLEVAHEGLREVNASGQRSLPQAKSCTFPFNLEHVRTVFHHVHRRLI